MESSGPKPGRMRKIVEYELAVARQKKKKKEPKVVGLISYDYELSRKIEALENIYIEQMELPIPKFTENSTPQRTRQIVEYELACS